MGRIMAIDYGGKRTGIAVTDPLQIIANGLTTVATATLMAFLKTYCTSEPVDRFVVGEPKNLDGSATHATGMVEKFVVLLQQQFPDTPITRLDERFTSKMAFQTMIDSGLKKKDRRNKALVDEISATILLQNFLQMR